MAAAPETFDSVDAGETQVADRSSDVAPAVHTALLGGRDDFSLEDFTAVMLRALIDMAQRSPRRQADLLAALRGADLPADPVRVRAALRLLLAQKCVTDLVPLSDGGVLLTVTRLAMEQAGPTPQWLPLEELDAASAADSPKAG